MMPVPSSVVLFKGLRAHVTRNLDKAGDYANGMEAIIESYSEAHRCIRVRTVTNNRVSVYLYSGPDPAPNNPMPFCVCGKVACRKQWVRSRGVANIVGIVCQNARPCVCDAVFNKGMRFSAVSLERCRSNRHMCIKKRDNRVFGIVV